MFAVDASQRDTTDGSAPAKFLSSIGHRGRTVTSILEICMQQMIRFDIVIHVDLTW